MKYGNFYTQKRGGKNSFRKDKKAKQKYTYNLLLITTIRLKKKADGNFNFEGKMIPEEI